MTVQSRDAASEVLLHMQNWLDLSPDTYKPTDALTFAPVEFRQTLQFALREASSTAPVVDPRECGFLLVDDDGKVNRVSLTDCPENRFAMAVKHLCCDNLPKFQSFMFRWLSLVELLHSGALDGPWYRRGKHHDEIDDRVVEVAASFPLESTGGFNPQAFLAALENSKQRDTTEV